MQVDTDIIVGPFKFSPQGRIALSRYVATGNVAILIVDPVSGERLLTASVLPHNFEVGENEVCIKAWSENEGCDTALLVAGLIEATDHIAPCGYECATVYRPIGELARWIARMPTVTDFQNANLE